MQAPTHTTTRLLEGLFDPSDDEAWRQFDHRYRPIIVGVARKLGLGEEDAADVAQETLLRFLKAYRAGAYDRSLGRLRSWIIGIARYRILDALDRRRNRRGWRGDSIVGQLPEESELESLWEVERRRAILRQALDNLKVTSKLNERTLRAFEMVAFEQRPASAVATDLGMTVNDVYQAKNRVANRLREVAQQFEQLYDEDPAHG